MKKRIGDVMEKVLIRDIMIEDIDRICEIENKSFVTPWSKNAFIDEVSNNKLADYVVVVLNNEIVGYGGMWIILDEAHVTNIAIDPDFRGNGLGNVLVEGILNKCKQREIKKITLEVRQHNNPALSLYKKYGFCECGIRKGYYTDTKEDAIIMWKEV